MSIHYSLPLSNAWLRMKMLLFRPFDISGWFVLGFTSFLASLSDSLGSGGGSSPQFHTNLQHDLQTGDFGDIPSGLHDTLSHLADSMSSPWFGLGMGAVLILTIGVIFFILLVLWLSSRGQFMFLDNLVHNRTRVSQPWSEFSSQGDSLFVWQIIFGLITMTAMGVLGLAGLLVFAPLGVGNAGWVITAPLAILAGTLGFIFVVAMLYINFFLTAFIVPIMHKNRCSTMQAWSLFRPLFQEQPAGFFLGGLFYFLITILGALAYFTFGLLTCCIGILLMAIPYIGSVITLPLSVTQRYFTLEFLGQFGEDFQLLPPLHTATVPDARLVEFQNDGTVVGPEDLGQDGRVDEPGPQS